MVAVSYSSGRRGMTLRYRERTGAKDRAGSPSTPRSCRFSEMGTPFWRRLLRFDLRADRLRLQTITSLAREQLLAELKLGLDAARADGQEAHALVYLHGFNVSFEEAAIRATQIGYDLKVPGATAFYNWPSRGALTAYAADAATIEASEAAITAFLAGLCTELKADRLHLIAHSMGNRGLLRAMQRIAADAELRSRVRFGQIRALHRRSRPRYHRSPGFRYRPAWPHLLRPSRSAPARHVRSHAQQHRTKQAPTHCGHASRGAGVLAPTPLIYAEQAQSSIRNPGTRSNSLPLWVTRTASSANAWAAISISIAPIGVP
jgi:hypothetical protein